MSQENQEHKIPSWLQRIQENSSELELLISGGAIYALIQLSNIITAFGGNLRLGLIGTSLVHTIEVALIAISVLMIGFILHLITRAYWLSLVCLNYVFPDGIKFENLKFRGPFMVKNVGRNDLYNHILKADKWCGLLMFASISSTIIIVFIFMPFIAINALVTFNEYEPLNIFIKKIRPFLYWTIQIYILDLLLSGIIRKIPYISYIIYPIFKFWDFITMRALVQRGFWILHSNTNLYKRTLLFTIFIFAACLFAISKVSGDISLFDKRFDMAGWDQNNYRDVEQIPDLANMMFKSYTIDSDIISKSFITLQIRMTKHASEYLEKEYKYDQLDSYEEVKDKFEKLYSIKLNEIKLDSLDWTVWKTSRYDYGIECIIPIAHLEYGKHSIAIDDKSKFHVKRDEEGKAIKDENNPGKYIKEKSKPTNITFWYDKFAVTNTSK